jgi:nitronate monooxygenase
MSTPRPTPFTDAARVELPLTLGAMYPCGNPELVAAVSEAGGLGIVQPISFSYVHAGSLTEGLRRVRDLTDKPIGFNAIVEASSKTYERRMARWIDEALEAGVRFFVTALGNPREVAARVHSVGGVVWHDVTELRFAKKAANAGVDGLIAVNERAGGHAGTRSMRALFDELTPLGLPVLAAGGLAGPEDLLEALAIGYAGIQMGTRFIATPECAVHEDYRRAIVAAGEEDIALTRRLSGVPVAIIRPGDGSGADGEPGALLSWMLRHPRFKRWARAYLALTSLRKLKRSSREGLGYKDVFQAGKSVAAIDAVEPAGELVARFRSALEASRPS